MSTWTLSQIIAKVRDVTATATDQLTNTQITSYINNYYTLTMPFELKEQINLQPLNFNTLPNQDVYSFPSATFLTDQPMAYADGFPLVFYQDRDIFFQDWPQQYGTDNVAAGDGTTGPYAGITQAFPVIAGTFLITDGAQVATDKDSDGILYQTVSGSPVSVGTIDYVTGAFSVIFNTAVATTSTVYDKYQAYEPARPQGVLFYGNEFTFRPIPDQVYVITMQGYINQIELTLVGDQPLFSEWGQLIAYGAALDIFLDRGDRVAYEQYLPILKRYENVALARYVQQFESQQSVPRF